VSLSFLNNEGYNIYMLKILLSQRLLLFAVVGVALLLVGLFVVGFWFLKANVRVSSPLQNDNCETLNFLVDEGVGANQIARLLEEKELIRSSFYFLYYTKINNISGKLQAGEYEVSRCMSIAEIADTIAHGQIRGSISVTIPEGYTISQIDDELIELNSSWYVSNAKARSYKEEFSFLESVPENESLEGFLFPDTYFLNEENSTQEVINRFLENFDEKVTDELLREIKNQNK